MYRQLTVGRRLAAPLFAASLALAACGGSGSEKVAEPAASAVQTTESGGTDSGGADSGAGDTLPAEDLFTKAPEIVPDPGGASATLRVSTKAKVACKVVYGTDEKV